MSASSTRPQRLTQLLLAVLALGVWGLLLKPYLPFAEAKTSPAPKSAAFDTLKVQRIDVVDPDGKMRLVIANSAQLPGVVARGKAYPNGSRSINDAAGVLFYDTSGNETGGLAFAKLRDEDMANMTFDYTYQPTDGIYIIRRESADGKRWQAGFGISDRRPYKPGDIESSQGIQRISLADKDHDAQLVISDTEGRPRIRIGVSKAGEPGIEMLDTAGKAVYRAGK